MFFSDPRKGFSYFKKVLETLIIFHLVHLAFESVTHIFDVRKPEEIWALSFAFWISAIYLFLMLCYWRHSIFQDRIEDCATAKRKLEDQVLANRRSSSKVTTKRKGKK